MQIIETAKVTQSFVLLFAFGAAFGLLSCTEERPRSRSRADAGSPVAKTDAQERLDARDVSDAAAADAGDVPPSSDASTPDSGNTSGCTPISTGTLPSGELAPFASYFSRYARVFGVHLVATTAVSETKLRHAAGVMAQYLDNNEDGVADDVMVVEEMTRVRSTLVMFATESELESSGIFESNLPEQFSVQDLYGSETHPTGSSRQGGFDATLEEVLHLITSKGYAAAYPNAFGESPGTTLSDAMDIARGGRFLNVPNQYPASAWYHYDDRSCDYSCMATEYFYWALTSLLGAQDYPGRCANIASEWEACTPSQLQTRDVAIHALLTAMGHTLPTRLPNGRYCDG